MIEGDQRFVGSLGSVSPSRVPCRRRPSVAERRRGRSRQAIMINVRSTYVGEPSPRHGVRSEVYARFSAPMREVVGVYLHKEMWDTILRAPAWGLDSLELAELAAAAVDGALRLELTPDPAR